MGDEHLSYYAVSVTRTVSCYLVTIKCCTYFLDLWNYGRIVVSSGNTNIPRLFYHIGYRVKSCSEYSKISTQKKQWKFDGWMDFNAFRELAKS